MLTPSGGGALTPPMRRCQKVLLKIPVPNNLQIAISGALAAILPTIWMLRKVVLTMIMLSDYATKWLVTNSSVNISECYWSWPLLQETSACIASVSSDQIKDPDYDAIVMPGYYTEIGVTWQQVWPWIGIKTNLDLTDSVHIGKLLSLYGKRIAKRSATMYQMSLNNVALSDSVI